MNYHKIIYLNVCIFVRKKNKQTIWFRGEIEQNFNEQESLSNSRAFQLRCNNLLRSLERLHDFLQKRETRRISNCERRTLPRILARLMMIIPWSNRRKKRFSASLEGGNLKRIFLLNVQEKSFKIRIVYKTHYTKALINIARKLNCF